VRVVCARERAHIKVTCTSLYIEKGDMRKRHNKSPLELVHKTVHTRSCDIVSITSGSMLTPKSVRGDSIVIDDKWRICGHDLFLGTVPEFELRGLRKKKGCSENFRMKV
jgi:hypothetical protein